MNTIELPFKLLRANIDGLISLKTGARVLKRFARKTALLSERNCLLRSRWVFLNQAIESGEDVTPWQDRFKS